MSSVLSVGILPPENGAQAGSGDGKVASALMQALAVPAARRLLPPTAGDGAGGIFAASRDETSTKFYDPVAMRDGYGRIHLLSIGARVGCSFQLKLNF